MSVIFVVGVLCGAAMGMGFCVFMNTLTERAKSKNGNSMLVYGENGGLIAKLVKGSTIVTKSADDPNGSVH